MKKTNVKWVGFLVLPVLFIIGCKKINNTQYWADNENKGVAIFTNTGNNVLSCFINGRPWRTIDRITSYVGTTYEIDISRQSGNSLRDTLLIEWGGVFPPEGTNFASGYLTLHLVLPPNFTYKDFSSLQGQRLKIDSANGFFSSRISGLPAGQIKGTGTIYFQQAVLDSISPNNYTGKLSGLLEADFGTYTITDGRFDHWLDGGVVHF